MRILIANDGANDGGGVQSYIDHVASGLARLGHELAFLYHTGVPKARLGDVAVPQFGVRELSLDGAFGRVAAWAPDVCYSQNMNALDVERRLLAEYPVVKFMHNYLGTCVGGQKAHLFPKAVPCSRRFGVACAALYFPRRCGPRRVGTFVDEYRWAGEQRALYGSYRAIVVASEHMRVEFERHGADPARLTVNPLFPTAGPSPDPTPASPSDRLRVLFLGRMTTLKGGDLLVRAVAEASRRAGREVELVMCGDGPQRGSWERLAGELGVRATFTGWVDGDARDRALREASVVAVPSVWPEPFGLVGLEAGALAIPAVAFDVGGIDEWLEDGVNGLLVRSDPPDSDALAVALARLADDPALLARLSDGARHVAERMTLDLHLGSLVETLRAASRPTDIRVAAAELR